MLEQWGWGWVPSRHLLNERMSTATHQPSQPCPRDMCGLGDAPSPPLAPVSCSAKWDLPHFSLLIHRPQAQKTWGSSKGLPASWMLCVIRGPLQQAGPHTAPA